MCCFIFFRIELLPYLQQCLACVYIQEISTRWRRATKQFHYPAESLDHGVDAVMAGTGEKRFRRQGFRYLESVAGQGEKTGHMRHHATAALD